VSRFRSSLGVLNEAATVVQVEYLQRMGFEVANVAYSPVDDYETDLARLSECSPDSNVSLFPGLVVTRSEISGVLSAKTQPYKFNAKYVPDPSLDRRDPATPHYSVDYRLVTAEYSARVYCATFEQSEFLINQIMLLNPPKVEFGYKIPWLEPADLKCVYTLRAPGIETRLVRDSERKTGGQNYVVEMKPTIRALLVSEPAPAPLVQDILYKIYSMDGRVRFGGVSITEDSTVPT
jgi:hypothetical protein